MKSIVINSMLKVIENNNTYDDVKLKEIKYGLESFYLTVTKTIVIFSISYILGTLKTLILLMLFYSIIRLTGFGLHAKKSWQCWISSGITFLLIPYLCLMNFNIIFKIIASSCCVILLGIYAPADTEKRPIISSKRRKIFKILTVITGVVYLIALIFVSNNYLENIITFALIIETILVLPISYKIFGLKYDNYKNYLARNKISV